MPKKHRPKRGTIRTQGTEVYFAYLVVVGLVVFLGTHLALSSGTEPSPPVTTNDSQTATTRLQVAGEGSEPSPDSGQALQGATKQSLQPSNASQDAVQGSGSDQQSSDQDLLQPGAGSDEYEQFDNE